MFVLIKVVVCLQVVEIPQPKPRTLEEALAQLARRLRDEAAHGRACSAATLVRATVSVQLLVVCCDSLCPR